MKLNVRIILAMFMICVSTFGYFSRSMAAEEITDLSGIEDVLINYFSERESDFYGNTISENGYTLGTDQEHLEFVSSWLDDLNLDVVDVSIQYVVEDVLSKTNDEAKLAVYEWVWIDYVCRGYDIVETMGFGTDHIINLSMENGEILVVSDAYLEITEFEAGEMEDLDLLKAAVRDDFVVNEVADLQGETIDLQAAAASYNAELAVAYADKWCGNTSLGTSSSMNPDNYNSLFYYYAGADCCNFVSQCLYAGGMTMSSTWYMTLNTSGVVTNDSAYVYSGAAWRYTPSFVNYWGGGTRITDASDAVAGNPIYWLASDGYSSNHMMLIVGTNSSGQILYDAHNNDAYRVPINLSSRIYYTIDLSGN